MSNELTDLASDITRKVDRLNEHHRSVALDAFAELERLDAETFKLALRTLDRREDAALWFTAKIRSLGWRTPWQCLAEGKREDVHRVLYSIIYGVYQ